MMSFEEFETKVKKGFDFEFNEEENEMVKRMYNSLVNLIKAGDKDESYFEGWVGACEYNIYMIH